MFYLLTLVKEDLAGLELRDTWQSPYSSERSYDWDDRNDDIREINKSFQILEEKRIMLVDIEVLNLKHLMGLFLKLAEEYGLVEVKDFKVVFDSDRRSGSFSCTSERFLWFLEPMMSGSIEESLTSGNSAVRQIAQMWVKKDGYDQSRW